MDDGFDPWLARWRLAPDGEPIRTPRARLLPVRRGAEAAMLKIATDPDEAGAAAVLGWWDGHGAARLLAADGVALLMERAEGTGSLRALARDGGDDAATAILCDAIAALHTSRAKAPPPGLIALADWFAALEPAARAQGGILARAAAAAERLLAAPREAVVLHGDIHHDNVLDFGARGWLAIDPKRLHGERGFDYANIFTNPDIDDPALRIAVRPERFAARLALVARRSGIDEGRLLEWILAWSGLSAAWMLGDGEHPRVGLAIAELAAAALDG